MKKTSVIVLCIACCLLSACQAVAVAGVPAPAQEQSTEPPTRTAALTATELPPTATVTLTSTPSATPTPQPTSTSTPEPAGMIRVDTLAQEVFPFEQNGQCSLGEAIYAANLQKQVDTCAAGGSEESTIELLPGTYRLTQIDNTGQQVDWAYSTTDTGNALPAVVRTLTLRGNGAVLSREDAGEPFRILEVLWGTFTLENITLQGGEVREEDWGGALLVAGASLVLDGVTVLNSIAENGGGVHISRGGLTVRNSTFSGNEALFSGGGLYADQITGEISASTFTNNLADGYGAGAHIQEGSMTVSDSIFIGNHSNARGGGINLQVVNASVLRSQFYNNYATISGAGVSGRNYIYEEDIAQAEADPLEALMQSETYIELATQIPGFRETLVADPSGAFVQRDLDIQVHDSCFWGNKDEEGNPLNASTAVAGKTNAENNYYGDPSGPSGMADGSGDGVGGLVVYEPFLTSPPDHCDLSLAEGQ